MPVLFPRAAPIHETARLHILETYIETLKAENESLKRQLADAEKRAAREIAKAEGVVAEFSAIARRLTARTIERASYVAGDARGSVGLIAPARAPRRGPPWLLNVKRGGS